MLRWFERFMWIVAVAAFCIYIGSVGERRLSQVYLGREFPRVAEPINSRGSDPLPPSAALSFDRAYSPPHEGETASAASGGGHSRTSLWAKLHVAQPLGRLDIPSIALSTVFIEGVDDHALRRAVGHIPGTALPGTAGNVGLSAHRDTFFRRLGEIRNGDVIRIATRDGTYEYVVESSHVIDPDERIALRDIGRPTLTLVTCYPFYYVGPAPKRFVVHASLVTE